MHAPASADLVVTARQLITCAPGHRPRAGADCHDVGLIEHGALAASNGHIVWCGTQADAAGIETRQVIDHSQAVVLPGLVDAHSHPAYAGSRVDEFIMRAEGRSYLDIMAAGGGIVSTVRATREASEQLIRDRTTAVFRRMLAHGTTTVEAKSGYGLDTQTELRDLRAIREAARLVPMTVVPTFLGAHALPPEHAQNRDEFVRLVIEDMLPTVARERVAEFCDVFCEEGAFTLDETRRILEAAKSHGLRLKIHAEEFAYLGGARLGAQLGATSVDHLLSLPPDDFAVLRDSGTVAVLLPGTTLFLGKEKYAPGRAMLESGVPVAVATDFNAGSCMSESMPAAMALSVLKMGLTPAQAIVAGTVNGAHAVARGDVCGSLEPGKRADFIVLELSDYREWLYHFGTNLVAEVWTGGVRVDSQHGAAHQAAVESR
jgi:imidazolonepropionase